ncbi:hypothetical protein SUGI_0738480 [Cryptomeria japonica]|nr:hypothetical protein SUGI_0738480 [Cryptomeria japonica]
MTAGHSKTKSRPALGYQISPPIETTELLGFAGVYSGFEANRYCNQDLLVIGIHFRVLLLRFTVIAIYSCKKWKHPDLPGRFGADSYA